MILRARAKRLGSNLTNFGETPKAWIAWHIWSIERPSDGSDRPNGRANRDALAVTWAGVAAIFGMLN